VAGTYTVTINGFNIPNGPQKFALAVDGGTLGVGPTPTPGPTNTPTNTPVSPTPTNTPLPSLSTGYLSPSANAAVTTGSGDNNGYQSSPANAYFNDTSVATDTNSGTGSSTACNSTAKDRHIYYNFSGMPGAATAINGIQVRLDARADSANGAPKICVEISWNGGTTWSVVKNTSNLTTTETTYTLGGTTDTWGHTWTAAELANLRVRITNVSSNGNRDFFLDYVAVNVTYQP
jgi:hypothetical protein